MNQFFLAATTPFVLDHGAASVVSSPVPTDRHLKYFGETCSRLPEHEEDHLIAQERRMLRHVVNGFAHPFLCLLRLQDDLWTPDLPSALAELVGREGSIGLLPGLSTSACVIWCSSALHLADMFPLEGDHFFRA